MITGGNQSKLAMHQLQDPSLRLQKPPTKAVDKMIFSLHQPLTGIGIRFRSAALSTIRVLLLLTVSSGVWICSPTQAQHAKQTTEESPGENTDAKQQRLTYDLGRFELEEIRPTRNETTRISFEAYFLMSAEVSKEELKDLENWKHRFRDQVITAVRTAQVKDFHEPQLERLRRIILFRVSRMMREALVEDILFSEFTFSME